MYFSTVLHLRDGCFPSFKATCYWEGPGVHSWIPLVSGGAVFGRCFGVLPSPWPASPCPPPPAAARLGPPRRTPLAAVSGSSFSQRQWTLRTPCCEDSTSLLQGVHGVSVATEPGAGINARYFRLQLQNKAIIDKTIILKWQETYWPWQITGQMLYIISAH